MHVSSKSCASFWSRGHHVIAASGGEQMAEGNYEQVAGLFAVLFVKLVGEQLVWIINPLGRKKFVHARVRFAKLFLRIEKLVRKIVSAFEPEREINQVGRRLLQDPALALVESLIEVQHVGKHVLPRVI